MLLNRVRSEVKKIIHLYFDRNSCRCLPLNVSIFLICDTLLLIHHKKQQQFLSFFNMKIKHRPSVCFLCDLLMNLLPTDFIHF
ncbi:hypothetical protein CO701_06475 [Citrobacter werkmanii]|nr:hypothetical protein CO701_06475 [Citrobacter werkmanii]